MSHTALCVPWTWTMCTLCFTLVWREVSVLAEAGHTVQNCAGAFLMFHTFRVWHEAGTPLPSRIAKTSLTGASV